MASLNLVPNPTVLVVQAGIFLVNIAIIKKLLLEPYLKVRERRDLLTLGSKGEADRALHEADAAQQKISDRLKDVAHETRAERERVRSEALGKRQNLISRAEVDARAIVSTVEQQIKDELTRESGKIPSIVARLTDEVFRAALA